MHDYADIGSYVPRFRIHSGLSLSADGRYVLFGAGRYGDSQQYMTDTGHMGKCSKVLEIPGAEVTSAAVSGNGIVAVVRDAGSCGVRLVHAGQHGTSELRRFSPRARVSLGRNAWAPERGVVAFSITAPESSMSEVSLIHLASGAVRNLACKDLALTAAGWSMDGRLLTVRGESPDGSAKLLVLDVETFRLSGTAGEYCHDTGLTAGPWTSGDSLLFLAYRGNDNVGIFELHVSTGTVTQVWASKWDVEALALATGRALWWVVNVNGYSRLHVRGLPDHDELPSPHFPPGVLSDLVVAPSGQWAVARLQTPTCPDRVVQLSLSRPEDPPQILVDNSPAAPRIRTVDPIQVPIPLPDGRHTAALLYRPPRLEVFPVLVILHGGPESQERPRYAYRGLCHWLVSEGIGVLLPNIGGSVGSGRREQERVRHDWGGRDIEDVRAIHRFLCKATWARSRRLGLCGPSYGGYLAMRALSQDPKAWTCAAAISAPPNLVTFCRKVPERLSSQILPADAGNIADHLSFLVDRSPASALTIADPLLLVQGTRDAWVPLGDTARLVESLRDRGVDARLLMLPEEGHELNGAYAIEALQAVGRFMTELLLTTSSLKGETPEAGEFNHVDHHESSGACSLTKLGLYGS
jgi:dipeptidyl aminopeptidase/acylaminoacyl peptidase